MNAPRRVVIHIDELVLRGFRPEDRHAIAASLGTELERLYATSPEGLQALAGRGDVARLRIGNVALAAGAGPAQVGSQLAEGLQRGLQP